MRKERKMETGQRKQVRTWRKIEGGKEAEVAD